MKRTLLFRTIIFIFSITTSNYALSQLNNWEEHYKDENVKIEYNYLICDFSSTASQELVIFRFTNLTENNITLEYETIIWNNNIKINTEQNQNEFRKTIQLRKGEIITIDCQNESKEHTIFSAFVHNETNERYITLTQFELNNIITRNE